MKLYSVFTGNRTRHQEIEASNFLDAVEKLKQFDKSVKILHIEEGWYADVNWLPKGGKRRKNGWLEEDDCI